MLKHITDCARRPQTAPCCVSALMPARLRAPFSPREARKSPQTQFAALKLSAVSVSKSPSAARGSSLPQFLQLFLPLSGPSLLSHLWGGLQARVQTDPALAVSCVQKSCLPPAAQARLDGITKTEMGKRGRSAKPQKYCSPPPRTAPDQRDSALGISRRPETHAGGTAGQCLSRGSHTGRIHSSLQHRAMRA